MRDCSASDGNGIQSMPANLVSEPFRRKVPCSCGDVHENMTTRNSSSIPYSRITSLVGVEN